MQQGTGKRQRELPGPKAGALRGSIKLIPLLPEDQRKKTRMQVTNLRSERGNTVTDATDFFFLMIRGYYEQFYAWEFKDLD